MLLFLLLVERGFKRGLAFLVGAAVLVTPHILEFSTIMMSEASCIFFIMLALWLYVRLPRDEDALWRSKRFYLFLVVLVFTYHIRTQAVALVVAVVAAMLVERRWRASAAVGAAFLLGCLPWVVRNALLGLGQSRYVSQIDFSGFFGNVQMLLLKAVPESVIPFFDVAYDEGLSLGAVVGALLLLSLIIYGFCKIRGLGALLLVMFGVTIFIIAGLDAPSRYRYLVIILPLLTAALFVGLWSLGTIVSGRF